MTYTLWYIVETIDDTEEAPIRLRGKTRDKCWKHTKEECEELIRLHTMLQTYTYQHRTFRIEPREEWKPGTKKAE